MTTDHKDAVERLERFADYLGRNSTAVSGDGYRFSHTDLRTVLALARQATERVSDDAVVEQAAIYAWEAAPSHMVGCFRLWNEVPEKEKAEWRAIAIATLQSRVKSEGVGNG
jgi:hypothetical protein